MHKLDRSLATEPRCLKNYSYPTDSWKSLTSDCKKNILTALAIMQGQTTTTPIRCAYCEAVIYTGHIEHWRRKNPKHYPELTFAWNNLFYSCNSKEHCGHYKDRNSAPKYDANKLIKPDEYDPEKYFHFHSSGEVRVRSGLNAEDTLKAETTINVLGLNAASLAGKRKRALSTYKNKILQDLEEIAAWPTEIVQEYIQEELAEISHEPYATTIKHFLISY